MLLVSYYKPFEQQQYSYKYSTIAHCYTHHHLQCVEVNDDKLVHDLSLFRHCINSSNLSCMCLTLSVKNNNIIPKSLNGSYNTSVIYVRYRELSHHDYQQYKTRIVDIKYECHHLLVHLVTAKDIKVLRPLHTNHDAAKEQLSSRHPKMFFFFTTATIF